MVHNHPLTASSTSLSNSSSGNTCTTATATTISMADLNTEDSGRSNRSEDTIVRQIDTATDDGENIISKSTDCENGRMVPMADQTPAATPDVNATTANKRPVLRQQSTSTNVIHEEQAQQRMSSVSRMTAPDMDYNEGNAASHFIGDEFGTSSGTGRGEPTSQPSSSSSSSRTTMEKLHDHLFVVCCCFYPMNRRQNQKACNESDDEEEKEYRIHVGNGIYQTVQLEGGDDEIEEFSDTYAFLSTSRFDTNPHGCWLAVLMWTVQMLIYFMVFFNTVSLSPFSFEYPPGVDVWTRVAQFLAILITALTQDDFITAIYLSYTDYLVVKKEEEEEECCKCCNKSRPSGTSPPNLVVANISGESNEEHGVAADDNDGHTLAVNDNGCEEGQRISNTSSQRSILRSSRYDTGVNRTESINVSTCNPDDNSLDFLAAVGSDDAVFLSVTTQVTNNTVRHRNGKNGTDRIPVRRTDMAQASEQKSLNESHVTIDETMTEYFDVEEDPVVQQDPIQQRRSTGFQSHGVSTTAVTKHTVTTVATLTPLGLYHGEQKNPTERFLSITGRFISGAVGVFTTFHLIMQATDVVELLLNFTAMEFVASLDGAAFLLAKNGLLGNGYKKEAARVKGLAKVKKAVISTTPKHEQEDGDDQRRCIRWSQCILRRQRTFLMLIVISLLLIGWGIIYRCQVNGLYTDNNVYVQLSDEFNPDLSSLSGIFTYRTYCSGSTNKRCSLDRKLEGIGPVMYESTFLHGEEQKGRSFFAYCEDLESWTFTYARDDIQSNFTSHPCRDYTVRSDMGGSSTKADMFDILSHASAKWVVRDMNSNLRALELEMDRFIVFAIDEETVGCHRRQKEAFTVTTGCMSGYGPQIFHESSDCSVLTLNERVVETNRTVDSISPDDFSTPYYEQLYIKAADGTGQLPVSISYRPVFAYVQPESARTIPRTNVLFFNGRRFVSVWNDTMSFCNQTESCSTQDGLASYLHKDFHPFWSSYDVEFISDPIDIGSARDEAFPTDDLTWYAAKKEKWRREKPTGQEISTRWRCCSGVNCDEIPRFHRDPYSICKEADGLPLLLEINPDNDSVDQTSYSYYVVDSSNGDWDSDPFRPNNTTTDWNSIFYPKRVSGGKDSTEIFSACVPPKHCAVVRIIDDNGLDASDGGGFSINTAGDEVLRGSEFEICSTHVLGTDCNETKLRDEGFLPDCKPKCTLCEDGRSPRNPEKVLLRQNNTRCDDFDRNVVQLFDQDSSTCHAYQSSYGSACNCAQVRPSPSHCALCPDGFAIGLSSEQEATCTDQEFILLSNNCTTSKAEWAWCCSTTSPSFEPSTSTSPTPQPSISPSIYPSESSSNTPSLSAGTDQPIDAFQNATTSPSSSLVSLTPVPSALPATNTTNVSAVATNRSTVADSTGSGSI